MSRPSFDPSRRGDLGDLDRRVAIIEDARRKGRPHGLGDHIDVDLQGGAAGSRLGRASSAKWGPSCGSRFHYKGTLLVSTSDDDLITTGGAYLVVWGRLTTAGTTTTTAIVRLDGTTVVTLTFASGVKNFLPASFAVATAVGQGLSAGITAVGTGAAGVVIGVVTA